MLDLHFVNIPHYVCLARAHLVGYQLQFNQEAEETNMTSWIVGSPTL